MPHTRPFECVGHNHMNNPVTFSILHTITAYCIYLKASKQQIKNHIGIELDYKWLRKVTGAERRRKTPLIEDFNFLKMEDDLIFFGNRRQTQYTTSKKILAQLKKKIKIKLNWL